jgi:low temperature requirement protein LtrA
VATATSSRGPRLSTALREDERVSPLELFFDLVFVLAITQCTQLMSDKPTWEGMAEGLLVLALLWWSWTAYAWLTSVVDPEDDAVRVSIFGAMAGLLIVSLSVPDSFADEALTFACAYAVVRAGQIALFVLGSRDNPNLRHSVWGLAGSTAIGVGLLVVGALLGGTGQGVLWSLALVLDVGGPYLFGAEGWTLVPGHFAERHGLIIIIALGESIVAIGAGAQSELTFEMGVAAVLGIALAAAMWWLYFDVVALVAGRRLTEAKEGRERNEMARDSYSYLHFLLIAGIVLTALGMKKILGHVEDPLETVPAFALCGGLALYLLGHVAFRYRHVHTVNRQRLALAIALLASFPLAREIDPIAVLAAIDVVLVAVIVYETHLYGERRRELRRRLASESTPA